MRSAWTNWTISYQLTRNTRYVPLKNSEIPSFACCTLAWLLYNPVIDHISATWEVLLNTIQDRSGGAELLSGDRVMDTHYANDALQRADYPQASQNALGYLDKEISRSGMCFASPKCTDLLQEWQESELLFIASGDRLNK